MKSKLKNICIVIERNTRIDKIIYDDFIEIKSSADINFLENQMVNWSYFNSNSDFEETFFKVYVQRYFNHSINKAKLKNLKSDDVSALLVIRVNDECADDFKSFVEVSFYENFDDMNIELMKVQYMTFLRMMNKSIERSTC